MNQWLGSLYNGIPLKSMGEKQRFIILFSLQLSRVFLFDNHIVGHEGSHERKAWWGRKGRGVMGRLPFCPEDVMNTGVVSKSVIYNNLYMPSNNRQYEEWKARGGSGFPILKHARMVFYTPHHDKLCRLNWLVALPGGLLPAKDVCLGHA